MTVRRTARDAIRAELTGMTVLGRQVAAPEGIPRPNDVPSPCVVVNYTGATDTEFLFNVEVYVKASDVNAQALRLDLMDEVDARLKAAGWGPPGDSAPYESDIDALTGVFPIEYPRTSW